MNAQRPRRLARTLATGLAVALAALILDPAAGARADEPQAPAPAVRASRDWLDQTIYLVMVDRFARGPGPARGPIAPGDPFAFHGGDLAGLIGKLDDLQDLGIGTIWITPINENQAGPHLGKYWPYHGYWIANWEKVDPRFGDEATLVRFVREAHRRGIKVLLDCVVNHAGYEAPIVHDPRYHDWFHHNGGVTDWFDPYQNENYDIAGLPDFNTENRAFLAYQERVWTGWFERTGIDGLRIDTVRHVPLAFWHHFSARLHALPNHPLLLGEVSYHTPAELAPYQAAGGLDGLFDFPLYLTITDVFAKGGSMKALSARLAQDALYPDAPMLSTFIDNHDYPRFLTAAGGNEARERLALAFLFTMRGIPSLYYGTEIAMAGGQDPDNRRDMAWGSNAAMRAYTRSLVHLRREVSALRRGTVQPVYCDDRTLAYARLAPEEAALVALNNAASDRTIDLSLPAAGPFAAGSTLVNRLAGERERVAAGRHLRVHLRPYEAKIYLPLAPHPVR